LSDNKIYKPKQISGFPELLPEFRIIELEWLDKIRHTFESYGFCSIETPAVEEVDAILAKGGDTEKEIYTLGRLYEDEESSKESRLALHFDLTVPMARYVAQHFNDLTFPFKRYQIQKSWRGERPQKGRFREFYQADIDVVSVDNLPLHFDAEIPAVMYEAYEALNIPPVEMRISNRKIICGYLEGLGINDVTPVTRILDKMDKLPRDVIIKMLVEEAKISEDIAIKSMALSDIKSTDASFAEMVRSKGVKNETMEQGLEELEFVVNNLSHLPKGAFKADLSIIRGLDYYTGTVLETKFRDLEYNSIGGGGRYENLAGSYINKKLPGIGVSIGVTRIFAKLMEEGLLNPTKKSPADILVVLQNEEERSLMNDTARALRKRGFNVETYHSATKVKKQMAYAEKKGIDYVWFIPSEGNQNHEVKNMKTTEQKATTLSDFKIEEK